MQIRAIRTPRLSAGTTTLLDLIDAAVPDMPPDSVLAITSKIVSLSKR
jgi:F420-0:gamma-glutamyl ligase